MMGIDVILSDELGNEEFSEMSVADPRNVLHRILPEQNEPKFHLINCINWYGDTTFNCIQAKPFLQEWEMIKGRVSEDDEKRVYEGIKKLAEMLLGPGNEHLYLKFIGD